MLGFVSFTAVCLPRMLGILLTSYSPSYALAWDSPGVLRSSRIGDTASALSSLFVAQFFATYPFNSDEMQVLRLAAFGVLLQLAACSSDRILSRIAIGCFQ